MANIEAGLSRLIIKEEVYDEYLKRIVRKVSTIQTLTERGNKYGFYFNEAKCMHLAQVLKTRITALPSPPTDKVRPVLRDVFFLVHAAKHLINTSCTKKWLHEAFWMGDCTEAFSDVIMDLHAAMENICLDMKDQIKYDGSSSRSAHETLGNEWEASVLEDRTFLISNVERAVRLESDLRTGEHLKGSDLRIAKLLLDKLTGKLIGRGIQLRDVKVIKRMSIPEQGSPAAVSCIEWNGKTCVMKGFRNHQQAMKEAAIMEKLTHPHIVQLLGIAYHNNSWAIWRPTSPKVLMEYVEKGDLHSVLKRRHKHFTLDVIVNIMLQIAKGMHYIHCKKIVHLDLKSLNIFVATHVVRDLAGANFFHVKIGDFGSAVRCDGPIPDGLLNIGTTRWRAPELFKDAPRQCEDLDLYKADVYSYAMVCVELLTGREPFVDEGPFTAKGFYEHIAVRNRPPLQPKDQLYPPELLSIVHSCWDADPARRPSFEGIIKSLKDLKRQMLFNDSFYSLLASTEAQKGKMWRKILRENGKKEGGKKKGKDQLVLYGYNPFISGPGKKGDKAQESPLKEKREEARKRRPPEIDIGTIHPLFNAEGCETLIQLGKDVKCKIDDFINQGATLGQHMFTSRLPYLQPVLTEFEIQVQKLFTVNNNCDISVNALLFDEVFHVLKKVEFFLAGCTWPALGFACGPTVTDEGFVSLRKDLQLCVHMMHYSMLQLDSTSYMEVSNFIAEPSIANLDDWSSTFKDACQQDQLKLLQFYTSIASIIKQTRENQWTIRNCHTYLGNIALFEVISNSSDVNYDFLRCFLLTSKQVYLGEGPEGVVLGPMPFLSEMTLESIVQPFEYHQPAVNWALKVYACKSRKMAYEFKQLASLHHPHVVQIFGHWEDGKCGYMAMKMMQANLTEFLSQQEDQILNPLFLVCIIIQIAEGMSYMHSHFVHHHNLKCSNILVGGCYKDMELAHIEVADYGFQRQQLNKEEDLDSESSSSSLSSTMSTEDTIQFGEGEETDEYAFDVYQFAKLCLEIFSIQGTGEVVPLHGATPESSELDKEVPAHDSSKISFPTKCPPDLALYFQKCAAKNPKERPKFPEIYATLQNHKVFMVLSGNQGT